MGMLLAAVDCGWSVWRVVGRGDCIANSYGPQNSCAYASCPVDDIHNIWAYF